MNRAIGRTLGAARTVRRRCGVGERAASRGGEFNDLSALRVAIAVIAPAVRGARERFAPPETPPRFLALPCSVAPSHGRAEGIGTDPPIDLVIADSQPIALDAMARVFEEAGFNVIAGCATSDETLAVLRSHRADVVVVDLDVPSDGLAILRDINRHHPTTRAVLFMSAVNDPRLQDALDLGVRGVVLKEMPPEALVHCVRKVHAGEQWMSVSSRRIVARRRPRDPGRRNRRAGLTAREADIVRLVARGLGNKDIARRLNVAEGTLKIHLHNIYRKLNVDSRLALTLYVQGKGTL